MKLQLYSFARGRGWDSPLDGGLDSSQTLVTVFGSSGFFDDTTALTELAGAFSGSHVVGCSTAGEIHDESIHDESLSVAVARFEDTELRRATAPVGSADDSFDAGSKLAEELLAPDLRGILVLSDGLNVNGSELVRGMNSVLPTEVVVTGGLAGDGDRFQRTWVIEDGAPTASVISAVGFYGDSVHIGHGSMGGWDLFGPERRITKSDGNVLLELDGEPALALYKTYLGDRASELPASALLFPLSLRTASGDEKMVVRTILSVDEDSQSMTFAGDVPEGSYVQLMRANFERLIEGAAEAALHTRNGDGNGATIGADNGACLSIAISCVGRRIVLGERTEEELEAALDVLPGGTRQVGFYSYGEISPYATGHCDLHNQTMTLTTISES